jgi:CO/xanthine dehydrogenase FAD-binding subunit
MPTSVLTPKTLAELVKMVARLGKKAVLVSGVDPSDRPVPGKVTVDLTDIEVLNTISVQKDRVLIGTGVNLGRLVRDAEGENGLVRQAASLVANPLVRNRITLAQALDPESLYFDIATTLVLLDAKVRLQSPTAKRTISIRDYLESVTKKGLKKGEMGVALEFQRLQPADKVGFFRVARMSGKGSVSAAARMRLARNVCVDPEIVVSSLTLIPLRSKLAEKEIAGKPASEESIKKAALVGAAEIGSFAEKHNSYEQTLIEITIARTLRSIMEGSIG